jgi:hypothetical protein
MAILVFTWDDDKSPNALRVLLDDGIVISLAFWGVDETVGE